MAEAPPTSAHCGRCCDSRPAIRHATIRGLSEPPMWQDLQEQVLHPSSGFAKSPRLWAVGVVLAIAVGFAYFMAARLSLALLTKPDGVAVFWPAAGISAGVLIAFGPGARWPVAAGAMAATILANL